MRRSLLAAMLTGAVVAGAGAMSARGDVPTQIGPVFVITMENHNWTQPNGNVAAGALQQIFNNPAAPFINSIVNPNFAPVGEIGGTQTPTATLFGGSTVNISTQTAYSANYQSVGAAVHPSEPNYLWQEAGSNFSITNDNAPYALTSGLTQMQIIANHFGAGNPSNATGQNLSNLLQANGIAWKSYQEGVDMTPTSGTVNQPAASSLTNTVAPTNQWTVPTSNFSGTSASNTNPYNGSHQYDFATKHDGQLFFTSTNGGTLTAPNFANSNPETFHYAPLEQLATDLANNTVAPYSYITPDQLNDMHTALAAGTGGVRFTYHGVAITDSNTAQVAQGDNFLSIVIPEIMASQAYQNGGTIIITNDETEGETTGTIGQYTSMEIVISQLAHPNVGGLPSASSVLFTHSSDLKSWQELYNIGDTTATGFLGDAANATDLADLFTSSALPRAGATSVVPEPASLVLLALAGLPLLRRRRASR